MCGSGRLTREASEPLANCKWPKSKWDKCGLVYLFLSSRDSTWHKARERVGIIFTILGGKMVSFNYIGHIAVEAEEALKDQTVRISVQNIFLLTTFSRFKGTFGVVKPKKRDHVG